jgi:transcriptional regulator GlxA family with amidase domain
VFAERGLDGPVDTLLVTGGLNLASEPLDGPLVDAVRRTARRAGRVVSVCTGALLLGTVGALRGRRATTHWAMLDRLADFGAEPVHERYVVDGKLATSAGVSAGIDLALHLVSVVAGTDIAQVVQLGLEYDPRPPFDAGSPATAPAHVTGFLRERFAAARA